MAPTGQQVLVYAMDYAAAEDLAMVLPVPMPDGSSDNALSFVDLSGCPDFFARIDAHFPKAYRPQPRGRSLLPRPPKPKLKVERVGAFEASFVPTASDFERLDRRFRLEADVLEALSAVGGFGYAVFKLRKSSGLKAALGMRQRAHPVAFRFPRKPGDGLFFPTLHVHDGQVHEEANFDHQLYWQGPARHELAVASDGRPFDTRGMQGLVDDHDEMNRFSIVGP